MSTTASGVRTNRPPGSRSGRSGLRVAGLSRLSTVDWPGHLSATVFLQGCPFSCVYCHNPDLISPHAPGALPWSEVLDFLRGRVGLLDAVVLSGGEATRQPALADALAQVRELGYAVGLHTAGPYPRALQTLLPALDWVGLDIKALPEDYPAVVGRGVVGTLPWDSLDRVLASGVDHEVRTTVHPGSPAATHAVEIARRCLDRGARAFALQQARDTGTRRGFQAHADGWDDTVAALAAEIATLGFEQFTFRPA